MRTLGSLLSTVLAPTIVVLLAASGPALAAAEPTAPQAASFSSSSAAVQDDDDDAALQPAEPDFRVVNLPTPMRLPRFKSNFTITHRFAGNLRRGTFANSASRFFGIDEGAVVGFEYRFAVDRHLQAVAYRSAFNRTVQFHGKYDAIHQGASVPLSISAIVSVEGTDNFQDDYAPAVSVSVGRTLGDVAALYAVPTWVHNSAALSGDKLNTFFFGVGARGRITPTVYLTAEISPRLGGYAPGKAEFAFAFEKRAGGHMFQLNVANTSGTTFAQVARGGSPQSLYLGFNLSRKFF